MGFFKRFIQQQTATATPEAAERVAALLPKVENRADCYGIDGADLAGHGSIVLTESEVAFVRWEPLGEWHLPIERIESFVSVKGYPEGNTFGNKRPQHMIRIDYPEGAFLFWTPERLQWLSALEEATGKKRSPNEVGVESVPGPPQS